MNSGGVNHGLWAVEPIENATLELPIHKRKCGAAIWQVSPGEARQIFIKGAQQGEAPCGIVLHGVDLVGRVLGGGRAAFKKPGSGRGETRYLRWLAACVGASPTAGIGAGSGVSTQHDRLGLRFAPGRCRVRDEIWVSLNMASRSAFDERPNALPAGGRSRRCRRCDAAVEGGVHLHHRTSFLRARRLRAQSSDAT